MLVNLRTDARWILATSEAVNLVVRGYALLQEMIHYCWMFPLLGFAVEGGVELRCMLCARLSDKDSGVMENSVR